MPPSPSLSARITSATYLIDTATVIDHRTSEMMPKMSTRLGSTMLWSRLNTVCRACSGLVPMSPNTTPSAASVSAPVRPECGPWGSQGSRDGRAAVSSAWVRVTG